MQGIEGVEELFLRAFFLSKKVDVIDQQEVDFPVAPAELRHPAVLDRCDQVVRETFARNVGHALSGVPRMDGVPDGVHEVRLAQTYATIDEERVVHARGRFGYGAAGSSGQ